jgi:hypothetical protein
MKEKLKKLKTIWGEDDDNPNPPPPPPPDTK